KVTGRSDSYRITLGAGHTFKANTSTPLGALNTLDPLLRLYDESGNLVASEDNPAPDGRNASLTCAVPAAGTYYLTVDGGAGTTGAHVLSNGATTPRATRLM